MTRTVCPLSAIARILFQVEEDFEKKIFLQSAKVFARLNLRFTKLEKKEELKYIVLLSLQPLKYHTSNSAVG